MTTSAAKANRNADIVERLEAEIARLRAALDIARTGLLKIERQSEEARAMITRTHEQSVDGNA